MRTKRRQNKVILSILVVAVLVLSIGYAAFSTILEISSTSTISPDASTFKVKFSKVSDSIKDGSSNPVTPVSGTGGSATISNEGTPTISNLQAQFTSPGQSVVYEFYAVNDSPYDAYLTAITYQNILNKTTFKECVGGNGASATLVTQACNSINVKVQVEGMSDAVQATTSVTNHLLEKSNSEKITVTIEYLSGAVDGSLSVTFGDISLTYSTEDNTSGSVSTQVYKPQYYSWSSGNIGKALPSDATSDVSDLNISYPSYLGLDAENGIVTAVYSCFTRNETEYCLKGYDTSAYETNKTILEDAFKDVVDTACSFGDDDSYCDADGVNATAYSYGGVDAGDVDSNCYVDGFGGFECYVG